MRRISSLNVSVSSLYNLGLVAGAVIFSVIVSFPAYAGTVTFGSGANSFSMEFVTIGDTDNASDDPGNGRPIAGSVGYQYGIGTFEVSRGMIEAYNASYGTANSKVITLFNMSTLGGNGSEKPATGITWVEAARFVNWLNTSTGGHAAYKFTSDSMSSHISRWDAVADPLDYNASNQFRSNRAKFVLPDYDEWYKAAYYNPDNSTYYDFPNGSDTEPVAVTGPTSGQTPNTAVYGASYSSGPANVNMAGGLSPYRVMGMGGNVAEWNEDTFEFDYDPVENRITRGGSWMNSANFLKSSSFNHFNPTSASGGELQGFRVVTLDTTYGAVPEPTSMAIFGLGALGIAYRARRKSKAQA